MNARVQRWGNSLAIRIPRTYASDLGVREGSEVDLILDGRPLIVTPSTVPTLDALLERITDTNRHVELDIRPPEGHEHGRRPALVLSPSAYNGRTGRTLACPITSRAKGHPLEVELPDALGVQSVVLADQVRCIDWRARNASLISPLPPELTDSVTGRLMRLLE